MGRERERVREGGLEGGREGGRVRGTVYNYVPAILEFKQSQGCSLMNIKPANQSCLSIYTITSVPCRAVPSV